MATFRNLGRLLRHGNEEMLDDSPEEVRMLRRPVTIEGTGEDVTTPELAPVNIYPTDDPRSELAPIEGGYPENWGVDPREPAPSVARRLPPTEGAAPEGIEGALAGLGGVADRAQEAMEADDPKGLRGFVARSAGSAAMGAGQGPGRAPSIPPEVLEFAQARAGGGESEYQKAQKDADLLRTLSGGTGAVHRGMDIYHGTKTPDYGGGMEREADRGEQRGRELDAEKAKRDAEVRAFVEKRLGLERQGSRDELDRRYKEAQIEKMGREDVPKPGDPLDSELKRARIAKLKAETDRAGRRGTGGASKAVERDVASLSKRLENLPAMKNDLATLVKFAGEEDIPGVGSAAGHMPNFFVSDDGVRVRQAVKGVLGALIKEQSGSAASEGEIDRKMGELGMADGATEAQFRLGLQRLIGNVSDSAKTKEAGVRPEAVEEARRRGMTLSSDVPAYEPSVPMIDPNGRRGMVKQSKVKAAIAAGGKLAE